MARHTMSYTAARENLAKLLDHAELDRDVVFIERRGHEDVALIAASELRSLLETAHLFRSPKNAARLLASLRKALATRAKGRGTGLEALRRDLGLGKDPA